MSLKDIDLGTHDARFDSHLLEQFVKSHIYDEVINAIKNSVIGRKGSGKTALFKKIKSEAESNDNIVISFDWQDVYKSTDKIEEPYTAIAINLQFELFLQLASEISRLQKKKTSFPPEDVKKLEGLKKGYLKRIAKFLQEDLTGIQITPFFSLTKAEIRKTGAFFNRKGMENFLQSLITCLQTKNAYILFDDPEYIITDPEDIDYKMIEALLFAIEDLNSKFKPYLKVLVFMQASIYDWLQLNFKDIRNIQDFVITIEWNEQELIELLSQRIRRNFPEKRERRTWEYWKLLFDIKSKNDFEEIKDYIFERIVNGPRDIIEHCLLAREEAIKRKLLRINKKILDDVEALYSESLLNAISQENGRGTYYEGIYHFINNSFSRGEPEYTKDELAKSLEDKWVQVNDDFKDFPWFKFSATGPKLIEKLYRVGFLGYKESEKTIFAWQSQDPTAYAMANEFVVRKAYRKTLSIT